MSFDVKREEVVTFLLQYPVFPGLENNKKEKIDDKVNFV
jgi:hypothetical protein